LRKGRKDNQGVSLYDLYSLPIKRYLCVHCVIFASFVVHLLTLPVITLSPIGPNISIKFLDNLTKKQFVDGKKHSFPG